MNVVVDASIAAAFIMPDESPANAATLIQRIHQDGAIAPALWQIEVANFLLVSVKRKRITEQEIPIYLGLLDRWKTELQPPLTATERNHVIDLAKKYKLTAYDATYLELALRTRSTLASTDTDLLAAAAREGLSTLS